MKIIIRSAFILAIFAVGVFAQAPQEKFVNVFGAKVRYLEAGDTAKPKVILLHGLGGSTDSSWPLTVAGLAADHHVIAPDMIGFGKSDKPFINYRVGFYADWLDKLMSELKIEKASVVGNSMGGWVAILFADKYPAKINKLVLVDAAGYAPPPGFDYGLLALNMNPMTRDSVRQGVKLLFANSAMFSSDAVIDNMIAARIAANDGYTIQTLIRNTQFANEYVDETVKRLKLPVLIIWGKQDGITPVAIGEMLHKDIAGSEMTVLDGAGHFPQIEKTADFNKRVKEFLAK